MSYDHESEHSEWLKRRIAPFAMLAVGFLLLFTITLLVAQSSSMVERFSSFSPDNSLIKLNVPTSKKIYYFHLTQHFPTKAEKLYSELEVELLSENYEHVYSVYKDLWQERHHDGEKYQIYKDINVNFELELPSAGVYYLRTISHNNNPNKVSGSYYVRTSGSLYYKYYIWILLGVIAILFLGRKSWGTPIEMFKVLPRIASVRKNKLFWLAAACLTTLYVGCLLIGIFHYGYAAAGDEVIIPNKIFDTENVNYLG